jgi:hypothetical protein
VLAGLSCGTPASLRIGSDTAVAPELNSPMYMAVVSSWAARRALAEVASGVQEPACAVESSSDSYLTVMSPALLPTCSSASLMPFTIAVVWGREAPCSGSDE